MKMVKFKKPPNQYELIRKRLGISQKELAEKLGVSRPLVVMTEKGIRHLPIKALVKLMSLENSLKADNKEHEQEHKIF